MNENLKDRIENIIVEYDGTEGGCVREVMNKIGPIIDKIIKEKRIITLRDAAKVMCRFCASPTKEKCSVATLIQGHWNHNFGITRTYCNAGAIHELIMELES